MVRSPGGPTILDLHSGALSYEDQFIDVYQEVGRKNANVYDPTDFAVYTAIKNTILDTVETQFNIKPGLVRCMHAICHADILSMAVGNTNAPLNREAIALQRCCHPSPSH